jgi:hypothetical protein
VIHTNGIHDVDLHFCECHGARPRFEQLLLLGWFPATPKQPETAATFEVLDLFRSLSTSKMSLQHFYQSLVERTDSSGLSPPPVCLNIYRLADANGLISNAGSV